MHVTQAAFLIVGIGMGIVLPGAVIPSVETGANTTATATGTNNVSGPYFAGLGSFFGLLFVVASFWLVHSHTERMELIGQEEKAVPMIASMRKCIQNKAPRSECRGAMAGELDTPAAAAAGVPNSALF